MKAFRLNKKYNLKLLILIPLFINFSCGGGRDLNTGEYVKNYDDLKELVKTREFEIRSNWVNPMRGNMINLIGNPNFIKFKNDSVNIFLPYFGVRQSGGGYGGSEGGIRYEGPARNLEIKEEQNPEMIRLRFDGRHNNEILEFYVRLYPNGNASTSVNSSQRDYISYQGDIRALPEEDEE